jgi:DNA polymerase alpha subunit B
MFNMTPENLFYKWEALSFNSTRSINVFTMDSAASLKASIQREIAAENNRKQQTRAKLFGKVTRGRVLARGFGAPKAAAAPTGAGISVKGEKDGIVAGPSRVTFKGPRTDAPARQDRSCESFHCATMTRHNLSNICPDRYMYEKISERSESESVTTSTRNSLK